MMKPGVFRPWGSCVQRVYSHGGGGRGLGFRVYTEEEEEVEEEEADI